MDWNNDGRHNWQDTAMDMYVMNQPNKSSDKGYKPVGSASAGKGIALVIIWILFCIFIGFLKTL